MGKQNILREAASRASEPYMPSCHSIDNLRLRNGMSLGVLGGSLVDLYDDSFAAARRDAMAKALVRPVSSPSKADRHKKISFVSPERAKKLSFVSPERAKDNSE